MLKDIVDLKPFGIDYEKDGSPVIDTNVLYDFLGYAQFVRGCIQKSFEWGVWYGIKIPVPKRSELKTDDDHITWRLDPMYKKQLEREDNPAKCLREEVQAYLNHFSDVGIISGSVTLSIEYEYLEDADLNSDDGSMDSISTKAVPKNYLWHIPSFDSDRLSEIIELGYLVYSARSKENLDEIIEQMVAEEKEEFVAAEDIDEYLTRENSKPLVVTTSSNPAYYHPKALLRGWNDESMILSVRTVEQILALMKHYGVYNKLVENSADLIGRIVEMGEIWAVRDRFAFYSAEYFVYALWYLNEAFYWNRFIRACEALFGTWSHFAYDLRSLLNSDGLSLSVLSKAQNPAPPGRTEESDGGSNIDPINEGEKISFGDISFSKKRLRVGVMEIRNKKDKKYYPISYVGRFSEAEIAEIDAKIEAEQDDSYKEIEREKRRKLMGDRVEVVSKESAFISEELSAYTQTVYKWLYAIIVYGKNVAGNTEFMKRKEYFAGDDTMTFENNTKELGEKFPKLANKNGLSAIPKTKSHIKHFLIGAKSKCILVEKITNMVLEYDSNRIIAPKA